MSQMTELEGNADLSSRTAEQEVYTTKWTNTWTITAPGAAPRQTTFEDLLCTLKSALYGPNIAAGSGEFPR